MGKNSADFMVQFNFTRQESIARMIDASPVASAFSDWFESRNKQSIWLTLKNLLSALNPFKPKIAEA
jgi:hypothetical protein